MKKSQTNKAYLKTIYLIKKEKKTIKVKNIVCKFNINLAGLSEKEKNFIKKV